MPKKQKQFVPLNDRVLIKRKAEEEKTASGLFIPDSGKEKPAEGTVIAVGSGKYVKDNIVPLNVYAGEEVLFGKYAGTEIKINDEEFLIVREEEILGVLR